MISGKDELHFKQFVTNYVFLRAQFIFPSNVPLHFIIHNKHINLIAESKF